MDFKIANKTSSSVLSILHHWLTCVHPYMPGITLVPSYSPTLISSLLRQSAHHLALVVAALQSLKSGTLSLHLPVPVPVLIGLGLPSVVTSRPSRSSNPLNPFLLVPQIRLLLTAVRVYKLHLLTYLSNHSTNFRCCKIACKRLTVTQIAPPQPVRQRCLYGWARRL